MRLPQLPRLNPSSRFVRAALWAVGLTALVMLLAWAALPIALKKAVETQGSALLDTATGHLHAAVRLVGCDPGMDYQLRIKDRPVAEGGAVVKGGKVVLPDAPGLGLTVDEKLIARLAKRR